MPAIVVVIDGRVFGIMWLEVDDQGIVAIRFQANPDKLLRANRQWPAVPHGAPLPYTW